MSAKYSRYGQANMNDIIRNTKKWMKKYKKELRITFENPEFFFITYSAIHENYFFFAFGPRFRGSCSLRT